MKAKQITWNYTDEYRAGWKIVTTVSPDQEEGEFMVWDARLYVGEDVLLLAVVVEESGKTPALESVLRGFAEKMAAVLFGFCRHSEEVILSDAQANAGGEEL